jgi:hypothetical protein
MLAHHRLALQLSRLRRPFWLPPIRLLVTRRADIAQLRSTLTAVGMAVAWETCFCLVMGVSLEIQRFKDWILGVISNVLKQTKHKATKQLLPSSLTKLGSCRLILAVIYNCQLQKSRARGSVVVKALCWKPEGRGFETLCDEWIFTICLNLPVALGTGLYSASNRNEYQRQKNNVSRK